MKFEQIQAELEQSKIYRAYRYKEPKQFLENGNIPVKILTNSISVNWNTKKSQKKEATIAMDCQFCKIISIKKTLIE